jgi:arylsulfatase B
MPQIQPQSVAKVLVCLLVSLCAVVAARAAEQPNIIHIVADDLGWNDVGFHGSEIATPNLDRLARESVILDRFYVAPICSPTRAGALTGRYPFRFGIWDGVCNPSSRHGLPPEETTIPELLAQAGYAERVLLGKWHLGLASTVFDPLNHGFTQFYGHYNGAIDYFSRERAGERDWHRNHDAAPEEGYSTDLLGEEAARVITKSKGPFYLLIAFNAPHSPLQATAADLAAVGFDPAGPRAPNTDAGLAKREQAPDYGEAGKGNTIRQTYAAMVRGLDRNLGRVLEAIEQSGRAKETIVLFHSDNGADPKQGGSNRPLRGNKFTTWDGGTRVVAMIRWPAKLKPGRRFDQSIAYVDILPTLAATIGQPLPPDVDGINFLPALLGKESLPARTLLLGEDTALNGTWKLKGDELFNVANDPGETNNVAVANPDVVAHLRAELARFAKLKGPPVLSLLPKPAHWPPPDWKLPVETSSNSSSTHPKNP